jgi:hypothetical protein
VKQCAVLFVNPERKHSAHPAYLRETGFIVDETHEWPLDGAVRNYHVVVVRVPVMNGAPMLAARLRAKPHFGRRLLIALVDPDIPLHDRRSAEASGFDDVLNDCCESRQLAARILRRIRSRAELRCALPPSPVRRSAA